eukprot:10187824-Lingulodinium_polyedra.AAC.1
MTTASHLRGNNGHRTNILWKTVRPGNHTVWPLLAHNAYVYAFSCWAGPPGLPTRGLALQTRTP